MYWRRIPLTEIPFDDTEAFQAWTLEQWQIKEQLLEGFAQNGHFPADEGLDSKGNNVAEDGAQSKVARGAGFIETQVQLTHWSDLLKIFVVPALSALACNVLAKIYIFARYGQAAGLG